MKLPDGALQQHIAIVGKTGSGKTYAAKGIVETLLATQKRVCVLDPTGAWYGLRSSADGKKAGFPIAVFGGAHADVPITAQSGSALARILAAKNVPAIVDLSEMLIGERHRFVTDFAEALYRDNRSPLHLVIDEADEFAPQQPLPETKRMLHHVDRIVRRGRIRGFRVMLITQRPAVLHKNVLTQANSLIAMRLTAPQDRKAIQAWIEGQADAGVGKRVLESLSGLQRGEGWVWSPEYSVLERAAFPPIRTFDSSRTPDDDEVVAAPTKLAPVDIDEIRASFGEIEQEAKTLDELRAEVARLKRELAAASRRPATPAQAPPPVALATTNEQKRLEAAMRKIAAIAAPFGAYAFDTASAPDLGVSILSQIKSAAKDQHERVAWTPPKQVAPLPAGVRCCLIAIAQHAEGVTRTQLSILTGYKRSTRDTYIQRMREQGLVELRGERVVASAGGVAALGQDFEPLPTGAALRDHWLATLPEGESRVLQCAIGVYPSAVARDAISAATGYARSSRDTYIQRLAARELVTANRDGVTAATALFD